MYVHGLFCHSTRTGRKDTGVILQCKNRRVGGMCYFIVHDFIVYKHEDNVLFHSARTGGQGVCVISQCKNIRVRLWCYIIVQKHESKGHVLFHSAQTGGQGSGVISLCKNRMVWVRKERTMYNVPREVHLMNFCSMRVNIYV